MKTLTLLILTFLLSGCQLYGGASVHDRSFDSEFKEDGLITTFGASQEFGIAEGIAGVVFIEHDSMPLYRETEGYGVQKLGFELRTRLW